jgi:hypothetical protein
VLAGDAVLAYRRDDLLVALNLSDEPQVAPVGALAGDVRLSTHLDGRANEVRGELRLRADEGVIVAPPTNGRG